MICLGIRRALLHQDRQRIRTERMLVRFSFFVQIRTTGWLLLCLFFDLFPLFFSRTSLDCNRCGKYDLNQNVLSHWVRRYTCGAVNRRGPAGSYSPFLMGCRLVESSSGPELACCYVGR